MLGDPCQLIVLIRPQWHQYELKRLSRDAQYLTDSSASTNSVFSHIEQRRWLTIAGPKTAELEINLKNAINCVRFLKRGVVQRVRMHSELLKLVQKPGPMTVHLMEGPGCSKVKQQHQRHQGVHPDQWDVGNPISILQHKSCSLRIATGRVVTCAAWVASQAA